SRDWSSDVCSSDLAGGPAGSGPVCAHRRRPGRPRRLTSGEGYGPALSKPLMEAAFAVEDNSAALGVFGERDEHLRTIERALGVTIVPRGNALAISGEPAAVDQALRVLRDLAELCRTRPYLTAQEVRYALRLAAGGAGATLADIQREDRKSVV